MGLPTHSAFSWWPVDEAPTPARLGKIESIESATPTETRYTGPDRDELERWYNTLNTVALDNMPHTPDDLIDLRDEIYRYLR